MRLHVEHMDGSIQVFDFRKGAIRLGRSSVCEICFDNTRYPKISSVHVELAPEGGGWELLPVSRSNSTLLNDHPVSERSPIHPGDRIRLGYTGPIIHVVSFAGDDSAPAGTLLADESPRVLQKLQSPNSFVIKDGGVVGRDPVRASFVLDHPCVSRSHCRIVRSNNRAILSDLGSANGTFVNGKRIETPTSLNEGDSIDIGPYSLELHGDRLVGRSRKNNVQLVADQIGFVVESLDTKRPICLLSEIDLVVNPREFVCILGPSGSGKSTLLRALSGRTLPSDGKAYINGRSLHQNFAALKSDLSVIPQAISLHNSLTVGQALEYSAALRLPPDLNATELAKAVDETLELVGLRERKTVKISQLSGGQLKRTGLAAELISDPSLLFLDEVTSGLDEQSDLEMMQLFRELADSGKTLVCVTHNLGNVAKYCTHVAVLTKGGRLAYFGSPLAATRYFHVNKLSDIYESLDRRSPESWAETYSASPDCHANIIERRPAIQKVGSQTTTHSDSATLPNGTWKRQFLTILRRTISVWQSDKIALLTLIGQPVVVALLLCLVFGQFEDLSPIYLGESVLKTQNLLFLLNVSCFWLGCNTSVKELVKEREIYRRETDFNLIPEAYFAAKLLFFAVIAIVQAVLLGAAVIYWFDPPGNRGAMVVSLSLLGLSGASLGQAISSLAKTEETAIAIVPMAVIPQIILGGIVASLSGASEWLGRFIATVYWGQHLLNAGLSETAQDLKEFQPSALSCFGVIMIHTAAFVSIAWWGVRRAGSH